MSSVAAVSAESCVHQRVESECCIYAFSLLLSKQWQMKAQISDFFALLSLPLAYIPEAEISCKKNLRNHWWPSEEEIACSARSPPLVHRRVTLCLRVFGTCKCLNVDSATTVAWTRFKGVMSWPKVSSPVFIFWTYIEQTGPIPSSNGSFDIALSNAHT